MIEPGLVLGGKYKILNELGHGGMACVYLADDLSLGRNVAVKVLPPKLISSAEAVKSFLNEAKKAAKLSHPNIVTVYGVDITPDGQPYFIIEYLQSSLKDLIKKGPLTAENVVTILSKVLDGLHFAHSHGVIHRDIKPENIMFSENQNPVIIDFGIAKSLVSSMTMTGEGITKGTPHYMSPEQCRGKAVDHRSDIYSLGIVMYEMITGKVPFEAEEPTGVMYLHVHEQPDIDQIKISGSSEMLTQVLLKSLSKSPDSRFATAEEFNNALKHCITTKNDSLFFNEITNPIPVVTQTKKKSNMTLLISLIIAVSIITVLIIYKKQISFEKSANDNSSSMSKASYNENSVITHPSPIPDKLVQAPANPFVTASIKNAVIEPIQSPITVNSSQNTISSEPVQPIVTVKTPAPVIIDFDDSTPLMTNLTVTAPLHMMDTPEPSGHVVAMLNPGDFLIYIGSKSPKPSEKEINGKLVSGPMILVKTKLSKTGWVHCAGVKITPQSLPTEHTQFATPVAPIKKTINQSLNSQLIKAIKNKNYSEAKELLLNGADPNASENNNWTALIYSIDRKMNDIVRILIETGANVNTCDRDDNDSPLGYAANRGNLEITILLIQKGAEINHVNKFGHTPLILAAIPGNIEIIRTLLEAGADPTIKDNKEKTAADWAKSRKKYEAERLLNYASNRNN